MREWSKMCYSNYHEIYDPIYSRDAGLIELRNRWIRNADRCTSGSQPYPKAVR